MADSTHNPPPEPRTRWIAAGVLAAIAGLFTALFARARLTNKPVPLEPAPSVPERASPVGARPVVPTSVSATAKPVSPRQAFAFIMLTVVVAVLLVVLQNGDSSLAALLFVVVIAGALILAVANAPVPVRRIILTPRLAVATIYHYARMAWKSLVAILVYYRYRIVAVATGVALLLMILSAQAFQVSRINRSPITESLRLMLFGGLALGIALVFARPNIPLPALSATRSRVMARTNSLLTGLGIAVLLFVSEINGKATHTQRIYPITTDTQFWLLVVGISLLVMGLAGWQPLLRLPRVKWRILVYGVGLVIGSALLGVTVGQLPLLVTNQSNIPPVYGILNAASLPFIAPAWLSILTSILNGILFWTVRLGDALILWAFVPAQFRPRITLTLTRQNILLVVLAGALIYVVGSLPGTVILDLAFALAVNQTFWLIIALANFARVIIAAIYRRLTADPLDAENASAQSSVLKTQSFSSRITHYSLLITVILLAIFARFYLLNDTMRFLVDEDSFISATHYLRAVPNMEILTPFSSIAAFPYMFPYFQVHVIDLFGKTFEGLRATSAILGVLSVIALYGLARTLFDRKTALLAALFLAVLPVHLQFSRIGISEIASPFFATLAITFVARGLLHGRRADFVIGGAMLGLTHYFHEGGRLLYTPLVLAWVVVCVLFAARQKSAGQSVGTRHAVSDTSNSVLSRQPSGLRLANLLIGLVTLVIVAAPIYYTLIAINRPLFARMVDNNSGLGATYWRNLAQPKNLDLHIRNHVLPAFQVYVNQVDNTLFYTDDNAFILPALVPIFLLGIVYAVWRWRAPGMLLLLMWLVSTSVGNSLMVDSAGSPRYVMVFPALALACAVGLRYTIPLLIRHATRARNLMVIAAVAFAFVQVNYFFNEHLPAYNRVFRVHNANPDGYDAALRSVDFPVGTNIHVISENLFSQIEGMGLLGFMRDNLYLDTLKPEEFTDKYISELRCRVDHAFFIERTDFKTLQKLRANFFLRDAQLTPYDDILPSQRLILFYAPYIKGSEKVYGRKC